MSRYRDIETPGPRHIVYMGLVGALFAVIFLFAASPLRAQQPGAEAGSETGETSQATETSKDASKADAKAASEGSTEAEEAKKSEGKEAASGASAAKAPGESQDIESLQKQLDATKSAQEASASEAQKAKLVAQTLGEEIATPEFPEALRRNLLQRSAAAEVRASLALGRGAALAQSAAQQQKYLEGILAESDEARAAREQASAQEEERRRLEEEATKAEKSAVEALAKARDLEAHERDETLRELLARQRKSAEETLALTRSHRELMAEIRATSQSRSEAFAAQKGDLLARIDAFPEEPSREERHESIDPLFRELIQGRRTARGRFTEILATRERAEKALEQAKARHAEAQQKLERVQATKDDEVVSEIYQRRVEAAEAEYGVAKMALTTSQAVFDERQKQYEESERRLAFYGREIPSLLPKISKDARADFFKLSDQNFAYAVAGLQEGIHHILRDADTQLIKPSEINLLSIDLWRWVWGLLWRGLLVLVLVRLLMPRVSAQIAHGTDALLKRSFFREHASATVRASDALDAISAPLLYFLGARFLAHYILPDELIAGFSTLIILRWALNALFLYWGLINLASVFSLPRWYRRKKQNLRTRLDLLFMEVAPPSDPANDPQLKRGKKLVRSIRVVLFFWLISKYVPDAARLIIGVSIFTWIIDFVARWSLFFIVYWVLSLWKDNIAAFFESLAGERMPRAVEVVNTRKDTFYGVFIIAAASVYVLGSELMRVARKYMLNTEWFRQASTLIFRAKIELRNREEESADEAANAVELPQDYVSVWSEYADLGHFATGDSGSDELISGVEEFERLTASFNAWLKQGKQGSVVLVGEPGSGKSTLLRHFERYVEAYEMPSEEDAEAPQKRPLLVSAALTERISTEQEALEFVADLFGLPLAPGRTEAQLLTQIRELEPHIIVLNHGHALFLRRIGGFDGLKAVFNIIAATDRIHFYALTFNIFAWSYVNRVRAQSHFFADVIKLKPWSDKELQKLIESRTEETKYRIDFAHLLQSRDPDANLYDEAALAKTARGYFRYLQEFCGGNPRLAITYWLRSLRLEDRKRPRPNFEAGRTLQVSLFRRPSTSGFAKQSDAHWFVLNAIVQHGQLSAAELAQAVHLDEGFCDLTLRLFAEAEVLRIDPETGQASLTPLYYRQVLKYLGQSNFLYE